MGETTPTFGTQFSYVMFTSNLTVFTVSSVPSKSLSYTTLDSPQNVGETSLVGRDNPCILLPFFFL